MCTKSWWVCALLGLGLAACRTPPPAPAGIPARPSAVPRNGLEVIGAMRRAHPSRELRSLTLSVVIRDAEDTLRVTRSFVYAQLPGRLRVEVLPAQRRSGYVRHGQRVSLFERGRRVSRIERVDLSTLVAYDVFAQSVDTTVMWLDSARVRFALLRHDELDGRQVWVVGAREGDMTSPQFWVDATEWRVVRVIQREPWNGNQIVDTRFTEYTEVREVPVPRRVVVFRGGQTQRHDITVLRINPRLPAGTFNLSRWGSVD